MAPNVFDAVESIGEVEVSCMLSLSPYFDCFCTQAFPKTLVSEISVVDQKQSVTFLFVSDLRCMPPNKHSRWFLKPWPRFFPLSCQKEMCAFSNFWCCHTEYFFTRSNATQQCVCFFPHKMVSYGLLPCRVQKSHQIMSWTIFFLLLFGFHFLVLDSKSRCKEFSCGKSDPSFEISESKDTLTYIFRSQTGFVLKNPTGKNKCVPSDFGVSPRMHSNHHQSGGIRNWNAVVRISERCGECVPLPRRFRKWHWNFHAGILLVRIFGFQFTVFGIQPFSSQKLITGKFQCDFWNLCKKWR